MDRGIQNAMDLIDRAKDELEAVIRCGVAHPRLTRAVVSLSSVMSNLQQMEQFI